jgi:hypothetical protein
MSGICWLRPVQQPFWGREYQTCLVQLPDMSGRGFWALCFAASVFEIRFEFRFLRWSSIDPRNLLGTLATGLCFFNSETRFFSIGVRYLIFRPLVWEVLIARLWGPTVFLGTYTYYLGRGHLGDWFVCLVVNFGTVAEYFERNLRLLFTSSGRRFRSFTDCGHGPSYLLCHS